jgi:hypothetical protein
MLRFFDGFDHYAATDELCKWTFGTANIVAGRTGNGAELYNSAISKTLTPESFWTVGFAVYLQGTSISSTGELYQLNHNNQALLTCYLNLDNTISLVAGNSNNTTYQIGTTTMALSSHTWYYLEIQVTLGGSNPVSVTGELHIDNQVVIAANTKSANVGTSSLLLGTATGNAHAFSACSSDGSIIDELYICDATVGATNQANNTFLGNIKIGCYYPASDDGAQLFTPTGGGSSYNQLNSSTPNHDAEYVASSNPGDVDMFVFQPVPALVGSVIGLQYNMFSRQDQLGERKIGQISNGGLTGPAIYLSSSWLYYMWPLDSPDSVNPWTVSGINSTNWGFTILAD